MPMYIVNGGAWAALIRAKNERHCVAIVDQWTDAGGCDMALYTGPVAIRFDMPIVFKSDELTLAVELERDLSQTDLRSIPALSLYDQQGEDMVDCAMEATFPSFLDLRNRAADRTEDEEPITASNQELEAAFAQDAHPVAARAELRQAQADARSDARAEAMRTLATSVDLEVLVEGNDINAAWRAAGYRGVFGAEHAHEAWGALRDAIKAGDRASALQLVDGLLAQLVE